VITVLASAPFVVGEIWPTAARYVPPMILSLLIFGNLLLALMTWRTEWMVRFLGGSDQLPESVANLYKGIGRQRVGTVLATLFTVFFAALWIKSLI
jgi:hypothetical protein